MKRLASMNKRGAILMMTLIMLPLLISSVTLSLKFSRFIERKIALHNGVDAMVLSFTDELATGLNEIVRLNKKLNTYHHWLTLVQLGKIITHFSGLQLTEKMIIGLIKATALKQDIIKHKTPGRGRAQAFINARKNKTPHINLTPWSYTFPIHRTQKQHLPGPYVLNHDFQSHLKFNGEATFYRSTYRARASAKLIGTDLLSANWKGALIE